MKSLPISVVIPTYRRPELLTRCLDSLSRQQVDGEFEIVVVDDGSGDETSAVLDHWSDQLTALRAFEQPENRGPAAARNRGFREARGELILFLDDDIVAPPDLVQRHLDTHAERNDPSLGILGRVEWEPGLRVTPFMRWLDRSGLQFAYDTWLVAGPVDPPYAAFYTCNLSLSRSLLVESGGFDERFPYPAYEDMELAWRLSQEGFRLEYVPEALAFHSRAIDLPTFADRMGKVAESAEILTRVQPDFPVEHGDAEKGWVRRRERWRLRLLAPFARLFGREDVLARHHRAAIAAAYREGRRRAAERFDARGQEAGSDI